MPTEAVGSLTKVGVGISDGERKAVAAQMLLDAVSSDLTPRAERVISGRGRGAYGPRRAQTSKVWCEGGLVADATPQALGYLLHALGIAPTTSGTGPYTHVFKYLTAIPNRWITIVHAYNNLAKQEVFGACGGRSLRLSWDAERGEPLQAELDLIGSKYLIFNNESTVIPSGVGGDAQDPFVQPLAKIEMPDGTQINTVVNGNIEVTMDRDLRWTVRGTVFPAGHQPVREVTVRGSLTLTFESDSDLLRFLNQVGATTYPIGHKDDAGAATVSLELIWSPSSSADLKILMQKIVLIAHGKPVRTGDVVLQSFDFESLFDSTNNYSVQFTLINNTSSYIPGTEIGGGYG